MRIPPRILAPLAAACFVAASSFSAPVTAQQASQPADEAAIQEARDHFSQGVKLFDAGKYEEARQAFARAYALNNHPAVLLNLAQCELRAERYVDAARHLDQYLRENPNADQKTRLSANESLIAARKHTSRVRIRVSVDGANVFVDGQLIGKSPFNYDVDVEPGTRVIEAHSDTGAQQRTTITVAKGVTAGVTLKMDSFQLDDEGLPSPDKTGKTKPKTDRIPFGKWLFSDPVGITLAATTVVGLGVTGTGIGVASYSHWKARDIEDNITWNLEKPENANLKAYFIGKKPCERIKEPGLVKKLDDTFLDKETKKSLEAGTWINNRCIEINDYFDRRDTYKIVAGIGIGVTALGVIGTGVAYYLRSEKPADEPAKDTQKPDGITASVTPVFTTQMQGLYVVGSF